MLTRFETPAEICFCTSCRLNAPCQGHLPASVLLPHAPLPVFLFLFTDLIGSLEKKMASSLPSLNVREFGNYCCSNLP